MAGATWLLQALERQAISRNTLGHDNGHAVMQVVDQAVRSGRQDRTRFQNVALS